MFARVMVEKNFSGNHIHQYRIAMDDDSTDIFNSNIIERYCDRPDINFMNGMHSQVDQLCLAEFAADYYKQYHMKEDQVNDNQQEVLSDDVLENHHNSNLMLPKKIRLMSSKETMKCRKVKAVIRFHTPNKATEPEKYFHHLLMFHHTFSMAKRI